MFKLATVMLLVFNLTLGTNLPVVKLSGDNGALVNGKPFSTEIMKGKMWLFFYVDPDVRKKNDDFVNKIKAQHFPKDKLGSIVVINMAATWLPNFALNKILRNKQKEFPDTIYVKDFKKVFVKKWGLKDNEYDVLLFDRDGKLIYYKFGKINDTETQKVINLIKKNLEEKPVEQENTSQNKEK
ncbi:conserved hypothetical protein [Thermotomaculum hydrothermale]|uniref:Uncharacterized protein n=1 Tax=Thermotomaculum hydrothermale TaxID=981385 RepID=A0A7R6PM87_9BACT|nr:YtfJ family protein [Thermotomaculum hydrothermale]BBB31716.1 conserved hypothetical protein [Thermotomaculum hydrothermale]